MLIKVFWITRLISKHQYCAYTLATLIRIVFLKDAFIIAARVMKEYIQQKMYFFSEKTKFFKRKLKPTKPILLNSRAILTEEIELKVKDYKMEVVIYIIGFIQ